jgi:hypothetical protein
VARGAEDVLVFGSALRVPRSEFEEW